MSNPNTQSNKMHCVVHRYFILHSLLDLSYMFQSLEGSSSGILNKLVLHKTQMGRDSVVGIATRYGLDGLGIESR
jgi:hypothetical protein